MTVTNCSLKAVMLALVVTLVTGCSSGGRASESEKAVQSINDMSTQVGRAREQVNRTVTLLDQLQNTRDIQATFKDYSSAVSDLKDAGEQAAWRGKQLREKREEYMTKWQQEMETMQNPAVKESLQQRRDRVRADYDKVSKTADDVKAAYQPFLSSLQETQKALSLDLTPDGVKSMNPAINKAKSSGKDLASKLDTLQTELNGIAGKMSP